LFFRINPQNLQDRFRLHPNTYYVTAEELFKQISLKNSYLCVGLDTDIRKIPPHLHQEPDPVFAFNKQIIDATADYCVAYKLNTAFYEAMGPKGWESLQKTAEYIPGHFFTIADAKRGDIGNTSGLYARAFFEQLPFDAVTVAPYMGADSVTPFLAYPGKWIILLALTSNTGSGDFQKLTLHQNSADKSVADDTLKKEYLFERVINTSTGWADSDRMMYVVGATRADQLAEIRRMIPDHFLLVPGVGAQGGDLEAVSRAGMNSRCGLLINSSRAIIYASGDIDFARQAGSEAHKVQAHMERLLGEYFAWYQKKEAE
jgi:orotidine-5'-phosphate decarboxylase